jgi:hypothetical protein
MTCTTHHDACTCRHAAADLLRVELARERDALRDRIQQLGAEGRRALGERDEARAALETIFAMCDPGDVQTPQVLRMGLHFARETAFKACEGEPWTTPAAPSPLVVVERMREALEPFAALLDPEDDWGAITIADVGVRIEDVRAARVALEMEGGR